MIPIIYPYDLTSEAAILLAKPLECKRVKTNCKYIYKPNHLIINLGNKNEPNWNTKHIKILNHWNDIKVSSNKLSAFIKFQENKVNIAPFSINIDDAKKWLNDGKIVVCRKLLSSSCGKGIVICKTLDELEKNAPDTKVFTQYFKHKKEYRVFIFNGAIIDYVQKKRKKDFDGEVNPLIKNLDNGYIFARDNVNLPEIVANQAVLAAKALNLQICGVDVGYNEYYESCIVFEANSNCGLCENGTTLKNLTNEILLFCQEFKIKQPKEIVKELIKPKIKLTLAQLWKQKAKDLKKKLDAVLNKP